MKLLSGRALVCSKGHAGHSPPPYEAFPGPQVALSCKFDVKLAEYLRWQRGGGGGGRGSTTTSRMSCGGVTASSPVDCGALLDIPQWGDKRVYQE